MRPMAHPSRRSGERLAQGGARARRGRRTLAGVGLVTLVLVFNGCNSCTVDHKTRVAAFKLMNWNQPRCWSDADCVGVSGCAPEERSFCWGGGVEKGICVCDAYRWIQSPDGGPKVLALCVHNPDGGAPVCGRVDGDLGAIVDEDGGILWDKKGGVR
jgi:hypothetical protein